MKTLALKANPCVAFERDDAPLAIHARMRWMNGGSADDARRKRSIDTLLRQQSADGSFGGSSATTMFALLNLALLGLEPDRPTEAGINYLLEAHLPVLTGICGGVYDGMFFRASRGDREVIARRRDSVFTSGCTGFVKTGAALYLATHFGQGERSRVAAGFEAVERVAIARKGRTCSGPCNNNLVQAVARAGKPSKGTAAMVQWLSGVQQPSGAWGLGVPFFPTMVALAMIDLPAAGRQVDRALTRAAATQGKSGTWRGNAVLAAFAVLSAAEARGIRLTW